MEDTRGLDVTRAVVAELFLRVASEESQRCDAESVTFPASPLRFWFDGCPRSPSQAEALIDAFGVPVDGVTVVDLEALLS